MTAEHPLAEPPRIALAREVANLRRTVEAVRADVRTRPGWTALDRPETARDTNGRYVLLDAQAALVHALTALTTAEMGGAR